PFDVVPAWAACYALPLTARPGMCVSDAPLSTALCPPLPLPCPAGRDKTARGRWPIGASLLNSPHLELIVGGQSVALPQPCASPIMAPSPAPASEVHHVYHLERITTVVFGGKSSQVHLNCVRPCKPAKSCFTLIWCLNRVLPLISTSRAQHMDNISFRDKSKNVC
ncbi:Glutamyl-tRNA(Gln) amidotransferase subunit A mitochondrial, partial [Dissostichus eleginoides]